MMLQWLFFYRLNDRCKGNLGPQTDLGKKCFSWQWPSCVRVYLLVYYSLLGSVLLRLFLLVQLFSISISMSVSAISSFMQERKSTAFNFVEMRSVVSNIQFTKCLYDIKWQLINSKDLQWALGFLQRSLHTNFLANVWRKIKRNDLSFVETRSQFR